jgi:hypothetical protein
MLKKIFSGKSGGDDGNTMSPRSPSFNDMSMGATEELEAYTAAKNDPAFMNSAQVADPSSIKPGSFGTSPGGRGGVWQGVFNPGRNFHPNMRNQGSQYWDTIEGETAHHPTIWDHVLNSDRHRTFDSLDKDKDGFISASDLHQALGRGDDVKQLIAAADANGDGRIDRGEFQELLRNSTIAR